jgi:hypothetical protein
MFGIDVTLQAPKIQCMFWCMFDFDVTAIYCDIRQTEIA